VTTSRWSASARVLGPSAFEMPYDGQAPVKFSLSASRGPPVTELVLRGELAIEK
jgi:hypothetical protein